MVIEDRQEANVLGQEGVPEPRLCIHQDCTEVIRRIDLGVSAELEVEGSHQGQVFRTVNAPHRGHLGLHSKAFLHQVTNPLAGTDGIGVGTAVRQDQQLPPIPLWPGSFFEHAPKMGYSKHAKIRSRRAGLGLLGAVGLGHGRQAGPLGQSLLHGMEHCPAPSHRLAPPGGRQGATALESAGLKTPVDQELHRGEDLGASVAGIDLHDFLGFARDVIGHLAEVDFAEARRQLGLAIGSILKVYAQES